MERECEVSRGFSFVYLISVHYMRRGQLNRGELLHGFIHRVELSLAFGARSQLGRMKMKRDMYRRDN